MQWRVQSKRNYKQYDNLVYSDDAVRGKHICKASIGDNELPGVTSAEANCDFIHEDYAGYAQIYSVLVIDATAMLQVEWRSYNVGDVLPSEAFTGGQKADGILLYICRALLSGIFVIGYYDPGEAKASMSAGSVKHPAQVELLGLTPNGPTSAGPTVEMTCPRFYVIQASNEMEWVDHRGP